jgi:hypothetical protein
MMVEVHLEVQRDDRWEYVAQLHHWSTHIPGTLWFAGDHPIPVRGIPEDVTGLTQTYAEFAQEAKEFQDATWITFSELNEALGNLVNIDNDFGNWILCMEAFEAISRPTRLVLWMRNWT